MGEGVAMRHTCNRRVEDAEEVGPPERAPPWVERGWTPLRTLCTLHPDNTGQGAQATKRAQTRDGSDPPPGLSPGPTRIWVSNAHLDRVKLVLADGTRGDGHG